MKADDKYTIPLCFECHKSFDEYRLFSREKSKEWFLKKLELTNRWLNIKEPENGVDF